MEGTPRFENMTLFSLGTTSTLEPSVSSYDISQFFMYLQDFPSEGVRDI